MRELNWAPMWAGLTVFVWYACGAVPLHIGVSEQLGLSTAQTSSWIFIVWFSGAVSTIAASIYFRQPIPITWTMPGLLYLGTLSTRFSFEELAAANLIAGLILVALGISGIGGRIMKWLPLPIVMGMFSGSILEYVTRMVMATVDDIIVAGTTVGCYLLGRLIDDSRLPPVGLAVIGGGLVVALVGTVSVESVQLGLPAVVIPGMDFSISAVIAVSLPMVVMAMGLGNIQGLGYLMAQGYSVPVNAVSTVVGVNSLVNALFGGHAATVARTGAAILASSEAGPASGRYAGAVISAALTIVLAFSSTPVASLLNVLPKNYVLALAGVAIISSLQDALQKSFGGKLRFGALVGFIVAATPFAILGITSAFWALIIGVLASAIAEREQLLVFWREGPVSKDRLQSAQNAHEA